MSRSRSPPCTCRSGNVRVSGVRRSWIWPSVRPGVTAGPTASHDGAVGGRRGVAGTTFRTAGEAELFADGVDAPYRGVVITVDDGVGVVLGITAGVGGGHSRITGAMPTHFPRWVRRSGASRA